jgi:hypothetical protein
MAIPETLQKTFPLIDNLHSASEKYLNLPPKRDRMSAHEIFSYTALESDMTTRLKSILKPFNRLLPSHWSPLELELVFNSNQVVTIRPSNPIYTYKQTEYKGAQFEAKPFKRLLGVMYGLLEMVDTPMNPKCQNRWDSLSLPTHFEKPEPILICGREIQTVTNCLSLHDGVSQLAVAFRIWDFRTLMTGSQRSNSEQSFKDGQKWVERNYFSHLLNSWIASPYFYQSIKSANLLENKYLKRLEDISLADNSEKTLLKIKNILTKVDTNRPLTSYSVFIKDGHSDPLSHFYSAHDNNHALACAMSNNARSLVQNSKKLNPQNWSIFQLTPDQNPF